MTHPLIEPGALAVLQGIGVSVDADDWVRDWTTAVPEFKCRQMLWIVDGSSRAVLLATFDGQQWGALNEPNLRAFNHGLEMPSLTGEDSFKRLLHIATVLLFDPRHRVVDATFSALPDELLTDYADDDADALVALRNWCIPLQYEVDKTSWRAYWRIMDFRGAILGVTATGSTGPVSVQSFEMTELAPAGTFILIDEF